MPNINYIKKRTYPIFNSVSKVVFAYLFGSTAHEQTHADSDIDIAVFLEPAEAKALLAVETELDVKLDAALPEQRVDLIIVNVAPIIIQYNAIIEGEVIFSRDEQRRIDFETSTLYRYYDLKPFLDEEKRLILEKLKRTG